MFKKTTGKVVPYQEITKENRKVGAFMSTSVVKEEYSSVGTTLYGKKPANYLTEGMEDLHKPMTDEEFEKSMRFDNDDLDLSKVLDSIPKFNGTIIYYEDITDK